MLWQKIEQLADRQISLQQTDHLSDRELYEVIAGAEMRELTAEPRSPDCVVEFEILGGYTEEDIELFLKYYADDLERATSRMFDHRILHCLGPPVSQDARQSKDFGKTCEDSRFDAAEASAVPRMLRTHQP